MAKIRIGQDYLDVKDFKPFLKLGSNDIGDISKKSASYSVDFEILWTSRNKTLLGHIGETNINTLDARGKVNNVFIEFGTVTYQGFLRVTKVKPKSHYEVYFATDVAEWTDLMKGKKLQDLNLSRYDHDYNVDNIIASFTNTEGYIYPFINYGFWTDYFQSYIGGHKSDYETKYNNYFPAVYDSTALRQCINDIGWSIDENSELLKESRFQNQITPFSQGSFTYKEGELDESVAYTDILGGVVQLTVDVNVQLDTIWSESVAAGTPYEDNSYLWDNANFEYIVPFNGLFKIEHLHSQQESFQEVFYTISIDGVPFPSIINVRESLSFLFAANKGDRIEIFGRLDVAGFATITDLQFQISVADNLTIPFNGRFSLANTLPDLSQIDFIKDIVTAYGCIVSTNNHNKTIKFDLFKNIETKKIKAVDWTHKIDASETGIIDYTKISSNYGQRNYFKYNQNDSEDNGNTGITPVLDYNNMHRDNNLGNGRFDVDNEFLKDSNTVYSSPFSSSLDYGIGMEMVTSDPNREIMFIPYVVKEAVFSVPAQELLTSNIKLFNISDIRKAIVIRDVSFEDLTHEASSLLSIGNDGVILDTTSTVPYCYFVKKWQNIPLIDNINYGLSYDRLTEYNNDAGLIGDYYQALIDIINKGYTIPLKLRLSESDIINLDFTQPFRLNTPELNGLFIINKIPKLNDINESIDVDLIKL